MILGSLFLLISMTCPTAPSRRYRRRVFILLLISGRVRAIIGSTIFYIILRLRSLVKGIVIVIVAGS